MTDNTAGRIIFEIGNPAVFTHILAVMQQNGIVPLVQNGVAAPLAAAPLTAPSAPPAPPLAPPAPAMASPSSPPPPPMAAPAAPMAPPPMAAPAPLAAAPAPIAPPAPAAPPAAAAPSGPVNDPNDPNVIAWQNAIKGEMGRLSQKLGAAAADLVKGVLTPYGSVSLAAIPAGYYPEIHAKLQAA